MTPQQPYFPPPTHNLTTILRSKSLLVMTKEALLPGRCVKCNAPTGDRLKRKLTWDPGREMFVGDAEANASRERKPRAPQYDLNLVMKKAGLDQGNKLRSPRELAR